MGLPSSVKPFEKSLRDRHRSMSPKRFQIQSAGHEDDPSHHLHLLSTCCIQDRGCPGVLDDGAAPIPALRRSAWPWAYLSSILGLSSPLVASSVRLKGLGHHTLPVSSVRDLLFGPGQAPALSQL